MNELLVPVLRHNKVSREKAIDYLVLGAALTQSFATRAATCAYSLPSRPQRLVNEDVESYGGLPMVLLLIDVDDDVAHRTGAPSTSAWRAREREKIAALLHDRPEGFVYFTPRGWRAVYVLAEPFVIHDGDDVERWRASYLAVIKDLEDRYAIKADPSGSRWGQCFDLPHATRDAGRPEMPETIGDAMAIGTWNLRIVEPAPAPKRGTVISDVEDSILGRWFIDHGMAGPVRAGKLFVLCPWREEHTGGKDYDSGTVIMPPTTERRRGWFHCSHTHCVGRDAEIFEVLGIEEERSLLARLRADLAEHRPNHGLVRLAQVEELLLGFLRDHLRPGRLLVLCVTLGAGKSRAVIQAAAASDRPWVIAVPTHKLGSEMVARLKAIGTVADQRRGVLRVLRSDNEATCKQSDRAAALQAAGGSVPGLLCRRCPHASGCPARRREPHQRITVAPHQLALSAFERAREDGGSPVLIFDESPQLIEELPLSRDALARGLTMLDGPLLAAHFAARLRPWLTALARAADDPEHNLARACDSDPEAVAFYSGAFALGPTPVFGVDPNELGHEQFQEYLASLRVMRAVLAAQDIRRIAWRVDGLAVHANTPEAWLLASGNAAILDATPDVAALNAIVEPHGIAVWRISLDVADATQVERVVLYSAGASRSKLAPGKVGDWGKVSTLLGRALEEAGGGRVLLTTHKSVADGLRGGELSELMGDQVDVEHYGALRGLDGYRDHDACVSLGDAWPDIGVSREQAIALGLNPETYARDRARAELAQAHGRLRDPSRSTPATHVHVGTTAPTGWTTENTRVVVKAVGRPRTKATLSTDALDAYVRSCGGQRAAASDLKISRRALRDYLKGRAVPPEVAAQIPRSDPHKGYAPKSEAQEAGRVTPIRDSLNRGYAPAADLEAPEDDGVDARHAFRERLAISLDGGASLHLAKRLALGGLVRFRWTAWAGAFDFTSTDVAEAAE